MQIASSGLRWFTARAADAMAHKPGINIRSIHLSHAPPPPRPPPRVPPTTAQRVAQTARIAATRFFQHLTTPGIGAHSGVHARARALQSAARPTVQQGFSLPVRHALLNKPFAGPHLPHAPAIPRGVHQVGLGTARAFHSGRPIFASLAENVPVAGRALSEVDVDVQKRKVHSRRSLLKKATLKTEKKGKGPRAKEIVSVTPIVENVLEDLDIYLPIAPIAPVTTRLLIPLAPTPSGRTPLPADITASSSTGRFLPLSAMASVHASHHTHSLRVSAIFARLDNAGVWSDPCVRSQGYGSSDGTCVLLEITFDGWDEQRVKAVLGDAGHGWCEIVETKIGMEDSVLDQSTPVSPRVAPTSTTSEEIDHWFNEADHHLFSPPPARIEVEFDPADSVFLPTLDLSRVVGEEHISEFDHEWDIFSDHSLSDGALSDIGSDDVDMFGLCSPTWGPSPGWVGLHSTLLATSPQANRETTDYLF